MPRPLIIAHRGASAALPENTIAAFLHAHALGADGVEMDVQETADSELLVMHDAKIGDQFVGSMTVEQVHARSEGCAVPTLREVLAALSFWKNAEVFVELKNVRNLGLVAAIAQDYAKLMRLHFVSFDAGAIASLKSRHNWLSVGLIASLPSVRLRSDLVMARAEWLFLKWWLLLVPGFVPSSFKNVRVLAWTVNGVPTARTCLKLGAAGLVSDTPDRMRSLLQAGVAP